MRVEALALPGVLRLVGDVHRDARGFLQEVWRDDAWRAAGVNAAFVQDNHSRSARGVLRGLHWQRRRPQGKLVTVIRGAIFDVVADVRPGSPTRGRWVGVELAEGTGAQLWIPPGYAHGFCVTSDEADVLYRNTQPYLPAEGRGVRWDDPTLAIAWPDPAPLLSPKDAALPWLDALDPSDLPGGEG